MVEPRSDEFVIDKHRYSAFACTELDNILRDRGIRTLVTVGVATNVCVESTFRDGFHRGFYIVIPRDAVGSHNKEAHEATLRSADFLFADVVPVERLSRAWSAGAARPARRAG
jgi:ureidoacrylate peracid hydrolase